MAYSDHKKPFTNINSYLPEVYRSDVNQSVFDMAFNRHLTKDDTSRVAGFIGEGNPEALVDRQIKEATPHRQAFQLAPTMYTRVGTVEHALSFKAFQGQLSLMGVDISKMDQWGDTLQFNWAPPINIDMLVNYQDYFWKPDNARDPAQYFTIENRCNKALSKVQSYENMLQLRGSSFEVTQILYAEDKFVVFNKSDDLFVDGFTFFTDQTGIISNVNLEGKQWTVASSSYDVLTNYTTIEVVESIANAGPTPPASPIIGLWWYDTNVSTLKAWDGSQWVLTSQAHAVNIDLSRLLTIYKYDANCTCDQSYGWDAGEWDQGRGEQWDFADECTPQATNPWVSQNRWIHKSQVQSFADVKRAQVPILEFNSSVQLNEWTEVVRTWKYRSSVDDAFGVSSTEPHRIELEPVKGFVIVNVSGAWTAYLYADQENVNQNVDYTATFIPGYKFKVTDDTNVSEVYTAASSEYRQVTGSDPVAVTNVTGTGVFCTIVRLAETTYTAQTQSGGATHVRIEPILTSSGDVWRGYHVHWVLNQAATTNVPADNKQWNYFLKKGLDNPPASVLTSTVPSHQDEDDGLPFAPQTGTILIGDLHQEQIIDVTGVTRVDLLDKFRCIDGQSNIYATPGSNELRVYVNGQRQYGTYQEVIGTADSSTFVTSSFYTVVGQSSLTTQHINYVQAIVFSAPLTLYDVVRIEVGPAALDDMGLYSVPVRTVEDETQFTLQIASGQQPEYVSLAKYQKLEQAKRQINQYPMFNVYDVTTSQIIKAAPLFAYREDSSASINSSVGIRISASSDGKDYQFEQTLLDRDNNVLYGYRNINDSLVYWYSPALGTVSMWDGNAWSTRIVVEMSGSVAVRSAVISKFEPSAPYNGMLWLDSSSNQLFQYQTNDWVELVDLVVSDSDPMLQTIWKKGLNDERYVPKYVDSNRNVVTTGSANGDWEVAEQWKNNPSHENRQYVSFSQLITHFRTILEQQPKIPGLQGGGIYTLTQNAINMGVGGTIKEYNDSYDTLISVVNVANTTPSGVIEFAMQQYGSSLLFIRDTFNKSIDTLFTDYSAQAVADFTTYVSNKVISAYELNDYTAQTFGDTVAFNPDTGKGVRNWVATTPMFGLSPLYRPHLTVDASTVKLFHHDGHRSDVKYTGAEIDRYARNICNKSDPRVSNQTFGKVSTALPPTTESTFVSNLGYMRSTVYWYRASGTIRQLYRFVPYAVGGVAPSFFFEDGSQIPDGVMYYNTTTLAVYQKTGLSWIAITTIGAGDITPLWQEISFAQTLGAVQLEVEQRLYEVTPELQLVFDYASLANNVENATRFNDLMQQRFTSYLAAYGITGPYVNNEYLPANAFTWNYVSSTPIAPPRTDITPDAAACWQQLYTNWYGTPYPHLEPWKLQGYHDKPTWWDAQYASTTGARRWNYTHSTTTGMWSNIMNGIVPAGLTYPDGSVSTGNPVVDLQSLPTYDYVSVNISDSAIPGGYAPDALLPPYYDNASISVTLPTVRSLFTSYGSEVVAPDADFTYGDNGPYEWAWKVSVMYNYDLPVVAFMMQPMRFMHAAFGPQYIDVAGLQVETLFKQVYSHSDVLFHGDIYNTNNVYSARGLNQWYVNFNRVAGFDTNGEFRQLWASWKPRLTYQFAGIVDTSTFEISNKYFDVIDQDYEIVLANNGIVRDMWVDAFEASLITIPPALIQYNNQAAWKIELDTLSTTARDVQYYGVKSYQFTADTLTNTFSAFTYPVVSANAPARRFSVAGDHTAMFTAGTPFTVEGGVNAGTYTVTSSLFETTTNRTRINVEESPVTSATGGVITLNKALPWSTGDQVVIGSSKFLPAPLQPNTAYYIIRLSDRDFQLAETPDQAILNNPITITSTGDGLLTVSQVVSTFYVLGGQGNTAELWYHYAVDKTDVRSFSAPHTILGMQTFINLIDGYAAYMQDVGHLQNVADSEDFDPDTGRLMSWNVETERFIDWAYGLRQARVTVADRYPVSVNVANNTLTFVNAQPMWLNGTAVHIASTTELPAPFVSDSPYYIVNSGTAGVVQLSTSANSLDVSSIVDITTMGAGQITLGLYNKNRAYPRFELNPMRNNMWVDTPLGVLSNAISGPYADIRISQTIFDQYGRPLGPDKLTVYRQDERSHVAIRKEMRNDVDPIYNDDPYNYVHFGGAHLFVEGFEHFLIFNDYTVGGALIYDAFLGLQAKKFAVDYFEKEDYTLRPTLGGYYLLDQQFNRNIEGSTTDVKNYYDVLELSESSDVAQRSRALIGYKGRSQFLDFLNINSKSQFMFYRGMIQTKGSVNSVKAYINSRRFVDARLDEFWAWKVAEFGDSRQRVYPEIKMFSTDGALDDVRLEFLAVSETEQDEDIVEAKNKGFQIVSFKDDARWNIFPEQKSIIKSPLFLDTAVTHLITVHSSVTPPPPGAERNIKYWLNTGDPAFPLLKYNATTERWDDASDADQALVQQVQVGSLSPTQMLYFKLPTPCDEVRVIRKTVESQTLLISSNTTGSISTNAVITLAGDKTGDISAGYPFAITGSTSNDGAYYAMDVQLVGGNTEVTVDGTLPSSGGTPGYITIQDFSKYALEVYNPGSGLREVTRVDSEVLRFNLSGFADVMQIFTLNPAYAKLSPARLIDVKSNTVVQQIPLWDPARGLHSHVAIHNVDIQNDSDPARYEFTPNPGDVVGNFWNKQEVGTVWLDTAALGYLPYYDDKVYPDVNDRLYNWGKLAPWAAVDVYQWVQSTVPPSEWDDLVVSHTGDSTIPQTEKASGTPRLTVFKRVRTPLVNGVDVTLTFTAPTDTFTMTPMVLEEDQDVLFTTTGELPEGLSANIKYTVANVVGTTFQLINPATEDYVTVTTAGTGALTVVPAFKSTDWNTQTLIKERSFAPYVVADLIEMATNDSLPVDPFITWPVDTQASTSQSRITWKSDDPTKWVVSGVGADLVDVYINGKVRYTNLPISYDVTTNLFYVTVPTGLTFNEHDIIDIVRPVHSVTEEEEEFDPDSSDDGTQMIQWKTDYQYCSTTVTMGGNNDGESTVTYYYFWVKNTTTRNANVVNDISALEVARQLEAIPTPYFVVQRPKDDPYLIETYGYGSIQYGSIFSAGILTEADYQIPVLYREAIIRKVASYINDDNRYVVRFTRDWALRDNIEANGKWMNLKNKHEEWFLFRKDQTSTLPRELWDRLTEALIGYKLTKTQTLTQPGKRVSFAAAGQTVALGDSGITGFIAQTGNGTGLVEGSDFTINRVTGLVTLLSTSRFSGTAPYTMRATYTYTTTRGGQSIRVPSLERELYDATHGTDTRYGLGEDQAFVDKTAGLSTVISYLSNPANDFAPTDIDAFFATNSFDTPENIASAMDLIYTTFNAIHVNAIWFETLLDALSTRAKYKELMKTSWIALHGIRVLEVGGLFDD